MKIEWKLSPNETREFAGFMCRKATGVIFDSVYVFAFYTDEITVSGGPMGLHGLPGYDYGRYDSPNAYQLDCHQASGEWCEYRYHKSTHKR
jgi:GLPGLI family protein